MKDSVGKSVTNGRLAQLPGYSTFIQESVLNLLSMYVLFANHWNWPLIGELNQMNLVAMMLHCAQA